MARLGFDERLGHDAWSVRAWWKLTWPAVMIAVATSKDAPLGMASTIARFWAS